ncbi:hypothetical protein KAF25_003858 [Fusarium avenaceum]|uniref:Clr5 domain-containing protein n=1 Tax=Fusarium avenaceum TaxID=40199 RepID=A0A9P7GSR8_9HYPO|nr:hypothetical protein KAF25_003858 [Fusarium avenaceum]
MLNLPAELLPQTDEDKFLKQKGNARWECLKPIIVKLYTGNFGKNGNPATIDEIADTMRRHYSFYASVSQYPHWFRKWGVSDRRMTKELVEEIAMALSRHSKPGMSTSRVAIKRGSQEEPLDTRKAKRHLKGRDSAIPPEGMQPGWLSSWVLPYAAFMSALPMNPEQASPYGAQRATPKCLTINSPEATSPGQQTDEPSPNLQLFYQKAMDLRSSLFLQGRLQELMISMGQHDRNWNPRFTIPPTISTPAATPQMWDVPSPWTPSVFTDLPSTPLFDIAMPPTQLCRWSIHVPYIKYEPIPAERYSSMPDTLSFTESLQEAITSGSCGIDGSGDLPVSREIISQALENNPTALQSESLRLAIMAGNVELLESLLKQFPRPSRFNSGNQFPQPLSSIHPFHLAASYLDGGGSCCMILYTLQSWMPSYLRRTPLDDLGHTEKKKAPVTGGMQTVPKSANSSARAIHGFPQAGSILSVIQPYKRVIQNWSEDCQVGWSCLHQVIVQAQVVKKDLNINANQGTGWGEMDATGSSYRSQGLDCGPSCILEHYEDDTLHCNGPVIGLTWATIQAELLTYRRLCENDPWVSNNFPMRALNAWLKHDTDVFESPLVLGQILKDHSTCGWFLSKETDHGRQYWDWVWPMAENACRTRFDILDDYKRSSFIFEPDLSNM